MIVNFLVVLLTVGCGLVVGTSILARLDPLQIIDRNGDRAMVATWLGLLMLANLFLALSLLVPLQPPVILVVVLLALGFSCAPRQGRDALRAICTEMTAGTVVGILAVMLGAAAYCSQVIVWYDSGLYHVQVVKWLSEYGLVPGLALIHSRFGFISSWFTLPAAFDHGPLTGRMMALPGALCLGLMVVHALLAWTRIAGGRPRAQDWFLGTASLLAILIVLVQGMPNAPTPDFPVSALVLVVAWAMLVIAGGQGQGSCLPRGGDVRLVPLLLAVGAVSIKLSALPLLAVAGCFYLFREPLRAGKYVTAGGVVCLGLLPTAAAGIAVAGCAFYPVALSCVDLPWSLGAAAAAREAVIVREVARWGMLAPEGSSTFGWLISWWRSQWIAAGLLLLSALAGGVLAVSRARRSAAERWVLMLGLVGIAYMLVAAPTWRFGLGYLVLLPALAVARSAASSPVLPAWVRLPGRLGSLAVAGTVVGLFLALHVHLLPRPSYRLLDEVVATGFVESSDHPHFNALLPPHIWNIRYDVDKTTGRTIAGPNEIVRDEVGDFVYFRTADPEKSDLCWDAPLPCAWLRLENIRLRQPVAGIAAGFDRSHSEAEGE